MSKIGIIITMGSWLTALALLLFHLYGENNHKKESIKLYEKYKPKNGKFFTIDSGLT